jgi:hypothetical protein
MNVDYQSLHNCYVCLSGMDIKMSMSHRFMWEQFVHAGFNKDDLELVIKFIQREIRDGNRTVAALKFKSLIEDTVKFSDDLAVARISKAKLDRQQKPHVNKWLFNKKPRSAAEVLEDDRAFRAFKDWRNENNI